jgi:hypothetical protein
VFGALLVQMRGASEEIIRQRGWQIGQHRISFQPLTKCLDQVATPSIETWIADAFRDRGDAYEQFHAIRYFDAKISAGFLQGPGQAIFAARAR